MTRRRLDVELVSRGLAESRTHAQSLIDDGRVLVAGAPTDRAARLVAAGEPIRVIGPPPRFVGRGGEKLAAAFDHWDDLHDLTVDAKAVDCGASTGGFTDCLLQHGAAHVTAVDVGHGQLHERIRADPRVTVVERTDIRNLDVIESGGPFDVLVADLSFISLRTVAPALASLCKPLAPMVLLVKPQFEVGRVIASRTRGVITDDAVRAEALDQVIDAFGVLGCTSDGVHECPVHGADGNREYLVRLRSPEAAP